MSPPPSQDAWAEAMSMLTEPHSGTPRSLVRNRRRRVVLVVVGVLVAAAVGAAFGVASDVGSDESVDAPVAQEVLGYVVALSGLVLQFWGVRRQWRVNRGSRQWTAPLTALSRGQRKQLADQVRGRRPVQAGTEELSSLCARSMVQQRGAVLGNAGLGVLWTGLWIASPSVWRALLVVVFVVLVVAATPFTERDARAGERFLDARVGS